MKKIVLTGGGTAGHVIPALALLENLQKHYDKIYYIGSKNGIEKNILSKYSKIEYYSVDSVKFIRAFNLKNLLIPFKLIKGICQAKKILKKINPNVVFSKGGFVAVPVVFGAKKLKIPIVSHESDYSLGLANKLILKKCNVMCTTFEDTAKRIKKGVCTGSPIKQEILNGDKSKIVDKLKLNTNLQTILIVGGSLGSSDLNNLIRNNIESLTNKYNIIHITGKGKKLNIYIKNYYSFEYVDDIQDYYAVSSLVISRAGSNVIFELLALKKPMLLFPLSKSTRGDQILNAKYFQSKGYCEYLFEDKCTNEQFLIMIEKALNNKNYYINNMAQYVTKSANKKIVDLIIKNEK